LQKGGLTRRYSYALSSMSGVRVSLAMVFGSLRRENHNAQSAGGDAAARRAWKCLFLLGFSGHSVYGTRRHHKVIKLPAGREISPGTVMVTRSWAMSRPLAEALVERSRQPGNNPARRVALEAFPRINPAKGALAGRNNRPAFGYRFP